jgi:hypothetical protein
MELRQKWWSGQALQSRAARLSTIAGNSPHGSKTTYETEVKTPTIPVKEVYDLLERILKAGLAEIQGSDVLIIK